MSNHPDQLPAKEEMENAHPSVRYEQRDVNPQVILIALAVLGAVVLAAMVILWPIYRYLSTSSTGAAAAPVARILLKERNMEPAEPRLQGGPGHEMPPQEELQQMRAEAEAKLNHYGWVDRQNGIAHIPITEAMRLLAEGGPSVLNVASKPSGKRSAAPSRAPNTNPGNPEKAQ
jgi:hypothetical protein